MRPFLTKEKAEKILAPYFEKIATSIKKGFTDYVDMVGYDSYSKNRITEIDSRARASMINSLIAQRIRESFKGERSVTAKNYNGVFGLHIKNKVLVRFKKFNKNLAPSTANTYQSLKIESQQIAIPGFPKRPTFLYAGYTFNNTLTGISNIYLALRVNGKREWLIDITGHVADSRIIPFSSARKEKGRRVTVKLNARKSKAV